MIIQTIEGKTREGNIQRIIVKENDKFGVAMIAYFKNSLNGQNVKGLAVKNSSDVQVFHNRIMKTYTLQILKFNIAQESIINNYNNIKAKYDVVIQDKISHL